MTDPRNALAIALFSEILTADQLVRNRLSRVMPKGMEISHFSVLNHLAHIEKERTPAQLAQTFHVTRGAMTNTLSRLETAGYVHIRPDWDDARRKMVGISRAGRLARDTALEGISPMVEELIGELGPDKVRAVLPILRELRGKLEQD
ncbi:MarR family winged helix-turn-helix transcriptional regulator [Pseudooceanicola nitratireducens]|jgi:DNA-binding MarR family transcriptional regulator|uniref:DNA-binding transcriptional regulator, MarR family n=1 Tax=Pseudooceanicola nitratireducens TaxID=517719 RepID=A0A1I1HBX8_9RHOB|nr:helix-turn-helix domain-containing protein [Pseudooceanicola nitratireducens]MEC7298959.1 helix-turn-helix domain-containing protein [Pseudomonadota bacterium]MBY6157419.1 MarR family transcriptional regulator [Pseudooceanicola nitratireducens]MEC7793235.1 helix-turn-helix domain-containing protein [Pseudomonadota bacterium]MEC8666245.1 helix-turn-helix domain-containing protein [Pseudomonadota bacterium]SEJ10891.1 DNA-binding transcriptional regulator, MarR family [Pseudooceanicola nitrati